jgi:hypothetical protein
MTKLNAKDAIERIRKMLFTDGSHHTNQTNDPVTGTSYTLKDGTSIKVMGALEPGVQVLIAAANGDQPAPDGELELSDGTLINITGGLITEVETSQEADGKNAEGTTGHQQFGNTKFETKVAELEHEINAIREFFNRQVNASKELVELVSTLLNLPSEEPVSKPKNTFSEVQDKKDANLRNLTSSLQKLKNN